MKPLPNTKEKVLSAILLAGRPIATSEIHVTSQSNTVTIVNKLRGEGLIRIADWGMCGNGHNWVMLLGPGHQMDAPKPARASKEELYRRKKERYAEKIMKPDVLPPPSLPKHTPTMGFWGI